MAQPQHNGIRLPKIWIFWMSVAVLLVAMLYRYIAPMPYRSVIWQEAQANHLSPYLVAAVIRVESSFRPDAVSDKGAVGLMQLIPSTAQWVSSKADHRAIQTGDLYDPAVNIHLGTWYLNQLLRSYQGNEVLGLAAYNAGSGNVRSWIRQGLLSHSTTSTTRVPFVETKNFVHRVLFFKTLYRALYGFFPVPGKAPGI